MPQLLSSSGEQLPELSQQGGLVRAHVSTDMYIPSWPGTHANDSTDLDTDSSTIGSSENSDHGFDHDIYDPMDDGHVSETEYNDSDNDGTMGDEGESDTSSTMSLSSTVENYFFLCGRRYPNQDTGYSYEPIDPKRTELWEEILTDRYSGDWAIDLADNNPGVDVIGIDIVPIQPDWIPPNVEFQIDDCEQEWTFNESSIDYIHARGLNGNVNRTRLTRTVFKTLKPGGVVEFDEMAIDFGACEWDLEMETVLGDWKEFFVDAGEKRRTPFIFVNDTTLQQEMRSAGFEDVKVYTYQIPLGTWSRSEKAIKLGKIFLETLTKDMVGSVLRIATEDLGWSEQQAQVFAATVRNKINLDCNKCKIYTTRTIVFGKKPGCS
ncbi:S-adenosyl-L-methionine-dependent methyltransferase [Fusarium redolens]|uniref:S-adenosyl-L-methionine-dependent methyltransferase n=1 Tax=Fusarium redolens TaxID=48865 RepID=A0A9P9G099_FUSRE|nr:S-adenosyl-L-methionine-dependent methyltransferase [Fusarium redolens]KAH7228560.1 S-adenosyl-L-methionine-dependent methyltransferase [Fusarium redolens]